jgi:hypothetical protein
LFLGTKKDNAADRIAKNRPHGSVTHPQMYVVRRGEKNPNYTGKLNSIKVQEIRKLAATGWFCQREIAELYCVSEGVVCEVIHRKSWKHVA